MNNKHEVVLHKNNRFVGTGHNSLWQIDDEETHGCFIMPLSSTGLMLIGRCFLTRCYGDKDAY